MLPLLGKDLLETAGRRRTWVLRGLAGLVVVLFFWAVADPGSSGDQTGRGGRILTTMFLGLMAGTLALAPGMGAAALAEEKERGNLELLLLTRLGPWALLAEKLLGRLVPLLTLVLLAMPALAVPYLLGGTDVGLFLVGLLYLLLGLVAALAVGLCCGALCTTTTAAVVVAYLICAAAVVLSRMVGEALGWRMLTDCLFPPTAFSVIATWRWRASSELLLASCLGPLLATVVALVLARILLTRGALARPGQGLLGLFRRLDRLMERVNSRVGGFHLIRERSSLPDDRPVAWRETHKRVLGRLNHLVRVGLVLELPVAACCQFALVISSKYDLTWTEIPHLSYLLFTVWCLAGLAIPAAAVNLIGRERGRQTLELLLTTPLESRAIVREKMAGLNRLIWLFRVPLLTVVACEAWIEYDSGGTTNTWAYLFAAVSCIVVYPESLAWLGMACALRIHAQIRALAVTVGFLMAWCVLPVLAVGVILSFPGAAYDGTDTLAGAALLSPLPLVVMAEFPGLVHSLGPSWATLAAAALLNLVLQVGMLIALRRLCLGRPSALLGRLAGTGARA